MKSMLKIIKAAPVILILFLVNILHAIAEEPQENPDYQPSKETEIVWQEAGTYEELVELLDNSKYIRLTSDITIPKEEAYTTNPGQSLNIESGPYTLYVEGYLRLQQGVTLSGHGGGAGLLYVRQGGEAHIHNVLLQAEEGFSLWQEEGAILSHTPMPQSTGEVHYAKKAVAEPHSYISWQVAIPVVVVEEGRIAEEELPVTDRVSLCRDGNGQPECDIAVQWDTESVKAQLDARERTIVKGYYPDAEAFYDPVCLVVFLDERAAVFLDSWGMESYGTPAAKVKIMLRDPELGCRFEWSSDKEQWRPASARESSSQDGRKTYIVSFPQDIAPSYPYYLSMTVDCPDGSQAYSDIIVVHEPLTQCGSGGNRGGGTDLGMPVLPPGKNEPESGGSDDSLTVESPGIGNSLTTGNPIVSVPPEVPNLKVSRMGHVFSLPEVSITPGKVDAERQFVMPQASEPQSSEVLKPAEKGKKDSLSMEPGQTKKSIAQMAAGIVVTCVIITFVLLWHPHGKN